MDAKRFDRLARALGASGSRRGALAALLAIVVAPLLADADAGADRRNGNDPSPGRSSGKRAGHGKNRGTRRGAPRDRGKSKTAPDDESLPAGNDPRADEMAAAELRSNAESPQGEESLKPVTAQGGKRRGTGRGKGKGKNQGKSRNQQRQAQAEAACYKGANCTPGPGKNLAGCDFARANLKGKNLKGANLNKASLAGADVSNANFAGANLGIACLVDAKLTGAAMNGSTNTGGAIYCRTTMPNGSTNDSGCARGTPCCPACDSAHPCGAGQVCCGGRCIAGDCCADGQCADPARPICQGNTCRPCTGDPQCGSGKRCCDGRCQRGNCCQAADCGAAGNACENFTCRCGSAAPCAGNSPLCCGQGSEAICRECCDNGLCPCPGCAPNETRCSARGQCVQCEDASSCPPPPRPDCQEAVCNAEGQCGSRDKTDGTACDDGDRCTVEDTCRNGTCRSGVAKVCAATACQTGTCAPVSGACGLANLEDGTECAFDGSGGVCRNGSCVACRAESDCGATGNPCTVYDCIGNACVERRRDNGASCQTGQGSGICCAGTCALGDVCCDDTECTTDAAPRCADGRCVACLSTADCPDPTICKVATCNAQGQCGTADSADGPTAACPAPGCCDGRCCTGAEVCHEARCCRPNADICQGKCGAVTNNCGQQIPCGPCAAVTCKVVDCVSNTCQITGNEQNAAPCTTTAGVSGACCGGSCCTGAEVCHTNACCTPSGVCPSNFCGTVQDGCGREIQCQCGTGQLCCDGTTCRDGLGDPQNCGACGRVCPDPPVCHIRACRNGGCVNEPLTGGTCPRPGGGTGTCCAGVCEQCCGAGAGSEAICPPAGTCMDKACINNVCTPQPARNGSDPGNACGDRVCCNGACADCCGSVTQFCPDPGVCKVRGCANGVCQPTTAADNTNPGAACPGGGVCCNGGCCPSGQVCCNGVCKACCGADASNCPDPGICKVNTCSNNTCVVQTVANGGDPGNRCPGDQACCDGVCTECCGADENGACPPPPACKSNVCQANRCVHINVADGTNPGNVCAPDSECCNGACCPSGQVCCNGVCRACCGGDASTCPDPGPCKTRACSNNTCVPLNKPNLSQGCGLNQTCCNGACAGCCEDFVSTCGQSAPCQFTTCVNGTCVINNKPDTTDPAQVSQCDSPGPCRIKACVSGKCAPQNKPNGSDVGNLCPGSEICCDGQCKGCCGLDAGTCPFPSTCQHNDCIDNVCTPRTVINGPGANCNTVCCNGQCCAERCGDFDIDCVGEVCRPSRPPEGGPLRLRCCLPTGGVPGLIFDFDVFDFVPNAEECCSGIVAATLPYVCVG